MSYKYCIIAYRRNECEGNDSYFDFEDNLTADELVNKWANYLIDNYKYNDSVDIYVFENSISIYECSLDTHHCFAEDVDIERNSRAEYLYGAVLDLFTILMKQEQDRKQKKQEEYLKSTKDTRREQYKRLKEEFGHEGI